MEEFLKPENQKTIKEYREDLHLDVETYSDEDVWEIVKSTKWFARLYVDEYKHLSPNDMLKQIKKRYNTNTDNNRKEIAR